MGDAIRQRFYSTKHERVSANAAGSHGCHWIRRGPREGQGYAIDGGQMTRWVMVADLQRCVGCQTCTAACKHANATSPVVQWRRVLDIEAGSYPNVSRSFVPVGCQHCEDPPCMHVCPSTATRRRADGIVTIDYDICIGCAYCAVACPYQARHKTLRPVFAYGTQMENEAKRRDDSRLAVATKCTFCVDRIDAGLAQSMTPGIDPEA